MGDSYTELQLASLMTPGLLVPTTRQRAVLVRYGGLFDTDLLVAMYRRLSERTIRLRFGAPRTHITDAAIRYEMEHAVGANSGGAASLVATVGEEGAHSAVALAQLVQLPHSPTTAEVAIMVRDDYQREGIGRALCRMVGDVARARGVRHLQIDTLAENQPVLRLIGSLGTRYTSNTFRGETRVMLALD